jgi:hypothetical protein
MNKPPFHVASVLHGLNGTGRDSMEKQGSSGDGVAGPMQHGLEKTESVNLLRQQAFLLEASAGIEPACADLQSAA